jgi:hypothetical protein
MKVSQIDLAAVGLRNLRIAVPSSDRLWINQRVRRNVPSKTATGKPKIASVSQTQISYVTLYLSVKSMPIKLEDNSDVVNIKLKILHLHEHISTLAPQTKEEQK